MPDHDTERLAVKMISGVDPDTDEALTSIGMSKAFSALAALRGSTEPIANASPFEIAETYERPAREIAKKMTR